MLHENQVIVDLAELTLNHGLFVVRAARSLAEAETVMAAWPPHMIVVDMEHDEASEFISRLCTSEMIRQSVAPILGLTRRGDLRSKLQAFELGVDDILTVPFAPEELLARALAITRRGTGAAPPLVSTIKIGEIEVDILHRRVRIGDSIVNLSSIEQSLLYLLASRAGRVVSRETILDIVWGSDYLAESNVVDRHVQTLRAKLQEGRKDPHFIATVPGKGYRFIPTFSNQGWLDAGAEPPPSPPDAAPRADRP